MRRTAGGCRAGGTREGVRTTGERVLEIKKRGSGLEIWREWELDGSREGKCRQSSVRREKEGKRSVVEIERERKR